MWWPSAVLIASPTNTAPKAEHFNVSWIHSRLEEVKFLIYPSLPPCPATYPSGSFKASKEVE